MSKKKPCCWGKLLPVMSHLLRAKVEVPATLFPIKFPATSLRKVIEAGPSGWTPIAQVRDPDAAFDSQLHPSPALNTAAI